MGADTDGDGLVYDRNTEGQNSGVETEGTAESTDGGNEDE